MTKTAKYITFVLAVVLLASVFITVFYYCRSEIPVCPEATGVLVDSRYYFDEAKNEWVFEQSESVIGEDLTAVRIDDFSDLNVIERVNYVPDEFIVPSSKPLSYDYEQVSLRDAASFSESGSIVVFLLNLDPTDSDFSDKAEALDKYKIGDYWKFSILLPKVFTAANVYVDSTLVATSGSIAGYEFIKYNTSDDRVSVKHVSEVERNVLEIEFYTKREALNDHAVTIHYQSDSETLAGLNDPIVIGTPSAVKNVKQQYPITFLVALVVSIMVFFTLILLSVLKKTVDFLAETALMLGVVILAVANYALANVTGIPLFLSALRYSASFVILCAAESVLSKKLDRRISYAAISLNAVGFVLAFLLPYVSAAAAEGVYASMTVFKMLSAVFAAGLLVLPIFRKTVFPSRLQVVCGVLAVVNVVASSFIAPSSQVLQYPPVWLYFALTVFALLTVMQIVADIEKENAYITANLNSEVDRQVKDIRSVISERDKLLQFVSHDLKKPLLFAENHLSVLSDRENDSEQKKLINIVRQNNKKVLDSLTDIAGYARLNYIAEPSRPVDLKELCDKLYMYCSDDCKAAGILLKNNVDKKISVFAKPQGLENALSNIILNAVEHADCTEITLSCRTEKNKVLLSVKDDGKGIPADLDVFRPYVSENKPEVSGLGLYICKNVVESMNGELTYSCNNGTEFTVALLKA